MAISAGLCVGSYLLGAVPFGLIIGLVWRRTDIRRFGSGNIGATNIYRTFGAGAGACVFVLDAGKGAGAVIASAALARSDWVVVASGFCAIAGHMFSPFLRFRGGKGVATSLGVMLGLAPGVALVCLGLWAVVLAAFRYVSVASILAVCAVPVVMDIFDEPIPNLLFGFLLTLGVLCKHVPNIRRLVTHAEPKISFAGADTADCHEIDTRAGASHIR
jgi:glycerol-3-phosphate acyltransferase PlsY